ncbi:MAG TPA: MBL fold metallo-hydrolase [Spirochaetia bacterium]|nr:MBL fold metallo-hydrolase [Spirochaetia bacterium]
MVERIIVGPLHTNAYIVSTGKKECILIDPGDEMDLLIQRLEAINMTPRAVIFTHGHLDHTSAAKGILEHYREKGTMAVGVHPDDARFFGRKSKEMNRATFAMFGDAGKNYFENTYSELPKVTFFLEDDEQILDTDFVVIHTPGHTPGSVSLYSESRNYVFSGDTLFFKGIGKADFSESDEKKLRNSVQTRLLTLPPETRLFPGHGPSSSIERENRDQKFSTNHSMF